MSARAQLQYNHRFGLGMFITFKNQIKHAKLANIPHLWEI